jgi:hypothetical protein
VASHISAFAMSFWRNSVKCGTLLGSVGRTQNLGNRDVSVQRGNVNLIENPVFNEIEE